jgi:hypothetical protein
MDISELKKAIDRIAETQAEVDMTLELIEETVKDVFPQFFGFLKESGIEIEDIVDSDDTFDSLDFETSDGEAAHLSLVYSEEDKNEFDTNYPFSETVNKDRTYYNIARILYSVMIVMEFGEGTVNLNLGPIKDYHFDPEAFDWEFTELGFQLNLRDGDSNQIGILSLPHI